MKQNFILDPVKYVLNNYEKMDFPLGNYLEQVNPIQADYIQHNCNCEWFCFDYNYALYSKWLKKRNITGLIYDLGCANGFQSELFNMPYRGIEIQLEPSQMWYNDNAEYINQDIEHYILHPFTHNDEKTHRRYDNLIIMSSMCIGYFDKDDLGPAYCLMFEYADYVFLTAHYDENIKRIIRYMTKTMKFKYQILEKPEIEKLTGEYGTGSWVFYKEKKKAGELK